MDKKVYVLYVCDEWKDKKSFNVLAVFDDFDLLKKEIKRMIDKKEATLNQNYIKVEDMELIHISNINFIDVQTFYLNDNGE